MVPLLERRTRVALAMLAIAGWAAACASDGAVGETSATARCQPGQSMVCFCAGTPSRMQTCQSNGTFGACPCGASAAGMDGVGSAGQAAAAGGAAPAGMNAVAMAGMGGRGGAGAGGGTAAGGRGGASNSTSGGMGGASGGSAGAGAAPAGDFEKERQACVDYINMYRGTRNLMPLLRATPAQEACSDMGAKKDGDSMQAHSSAGDCQGLGGQNTCPGYALSFGGGTLEGALKVCLDQMWDEGEPTEGVQACIDDRAGCFQMHGHWINMTMTSYGRVACGFYKMANGRYWMNQNFGR